MMLTNVLPLVDMPLEVFPNKVSRQSALYSLRTSAERSDGWFMVRCFPQDQFNSSFNLFAPNSGEWVLGKISAGPSGIFEVHLYFGNKNLSTLCMTPVELAEILEDLDFYGAACVFENPQVWSPTLENPFEDIPFGIAPLDLRIEMSFPR